MSDKKEGEEVAIDMAKVCGICFDNEAERLLDCCNPIRVCQECIDGAIQESLRRRAIPFKCITSGKCVLNYEDIKQLVCEELS